MDAEQAEPRRLSALVLDLLGRHLDEGRFTPGLVLLEGPLADRMGTSRAPVRLALQTLLRQRRLTKFDGRGAQVPGAAPLRRPLETAGLVVPDAFHEAVRQGRATWDRIFGEVERAISTALPFGRLRVRESRMAAHFGVSRTVTGDVLSRLHERGLVQQAARGAWVAGPLDADAMRELYQIRRLLEPAALTQAAASLDRTRLATMRDRLRMAEEAYPAVSPEALYGFEQDLHEGCVLAKPGRLSAIIRQSQVPLVATNHLFQTRLGVPVQEPFLLEHRLVVEHLLAGSPDAAAAALAAHLDSALAKGLARLKVLATLPAPELPTFLALRPDS